MKKYTDWMNVAVGLIVATLGAALVLKSVQSFGRGKFRYPGAIVTTLFDYHFAGFIVATILFLIMFGTASFAFAKRLAYKNSKAGTMLIRVAMIVGLPLSTTIGMIGCLTPEQFGIVTGVISFFALFSLAIQHAFKNFIHELFIQNRYQNKPDQESNKQNNS